MATETLKTRTSSRHSPLRLRLPPAVALSDEQLLEFSSLNGDLRLELTSQGDLIVMPPAGGGTGDREAEIIMQLRLWAKEDGSGKAFSPSTGFRLPNGAVRSPDASWVNSARLEGLTAEEREKYLPLCPEFVVELRSPTDSLKSLREKMQEYIDNGTRLGWLIDPQRERVMVYMPEGVRELEGSETLSGELVLPGFTLDLRDVWN